jgi:hypothetical protein
MRRAAPPRWPRRARCSPAARSTLAAAAKLRARWRWRPCCAAAPSRRAQRVPAALTLHEKRPRPWLRQCGGVRARRAPTAARQRHEGWDCAADVCVVCRLRVLSSLYPRRLLPSAPATHARCCQQRAAARCTLRSGAPGAVNAARSSRRRTTDAAAAQAGPREEAAQGVQGREEGGAQPRWLPVCGCSGGRHGGGCHLVRLRACAVRELQPCLTRSAWRVQGHHLVRARLAAPVAGAQLLGRVLPCNALRLTQRSHPRRTCARGWRPSRWCSPSTRRAAWTAGVRVA